jgi:Na+/proline symporter
MGIELSPGSSQVLVTFLMYLIAVAALGVFAHRYVTRGSFVKQYFLGNRGLGAWVLALTVAATAISGGTFMGFPSLIYTNGWVMAMWICSYMVVPLTGMIWLGKRINQVARIGGSVTVPDVFRDRFQSPALGIVASLLILFFVCFNLVAQFKAGGIVLQTALRLKPPLAELVEAQVSKDNFLVLEFKTPRGRDAQKTPLPSKTAVFLPERTEVDQEQREARVFFRDGDAETSKKVRFPPARFSIPWMQQGIDAGYLFGLLIFALTVIAYTTYGGFWAVTWTDVFEGLVMLAGVLLMAILAVNAVEPVQIDGVTVTGLAAATETIGDQDPRLVSGPGPGMFLPLGMAFSYFIMWSVSGAGQPSGMVRLMSFRDSASLSRALVLIAFYYAVTYISLLVIFICARAIFPTQYLREIGTEGEPDSIMPEMARYLTERAGMPWAAGLLLAAPYAAIMSTVAAFLLMISSSLVRDLYQRSINPNASQKTLKRVSYATTAVAGTAVMVGAINPPDFLQYIIVFTGSGQSCAFFFPMLLTLYWRRTTGHGVLAGMIAGALTVFLLYILGWIDGGTRGATSGLGVWLRQSLSWLPGWGDDRLGSFAPLNLASFDPIFWGFLASLLFTVGISLRTRPNEDLVKTYFPEGPS